MTRSIQTNDECVRLEYYGQVLSLPDEGSNLAEQLAYHRLLPLEETDGTIRIVRSSESMLSPVLPRANLGLREVVIAQALRQDRSLEHRRRTRAYPTLPQPVEIQPIAGRPISTHVNQFVHQFDRGVILIGTGVEQCAILAELVTAFPFQGFAILTATHRQSRNVQNELRKLSIGCQRFPNRSHNQSGERVVVGAFDSLRDRAVEIEKREILIAFDAHQALAEAAQQLLTQPDVCGRLFGFLREGTHLSPLKDDQLVATFGFDQVAVPAHGFCFVHVDAVFAEYRASMGVKGKKAVTIKRRGIWKDGHRNRNVTKLARALTEGDREALSRLLPEHETQLALNQPRRVALLTDSVEHVAGLAHRLRHWPIRLDRDYFDAELPAHEQRLLARGMSRWITGEALIATPQGLFEVPPGTFDVVIWAGSGSGFPPIPWSHLVCPDSKPRRLLLIDVRDRHHPQLRRWSQQRRDLYSEVGWMDLGMNRTLARICRFLDRKNAEVGQ